MQHCYIPFFMLLIPNGLLVLARHRDQRLQARWPSIVPVHTPNHASWLNQVEIYFSVVQRKVLTPNDFHSLAQLEEALLAFHQRYEKSTAPFHWTFNREDLAMLMIRLRAKALATAA